MRTHKISISFLLIVSVFILAACQNKKPTDISVSPNQQSVGELPAVQMKPVQSDDPSTYPPENFISLNGSDNKKNGDAYRTYLQNKFIIKIAVTLPNTSSNANYTAYLVNPSTKKFISLGSLSQKEDKWVGDYSSDRDGKEFTHMVIVSGKDVNDPDKGTVVSSGDFRN